MIFDEREHAFCENIRTLRRRNRLSKRQMSSILGIGIPTLNQLEAGHLPRRLSAGILLRIHSHFGLLPEQMISPDTDLSV